MTSNLSTDSHMTDVFGRFPSSKSTLSDSSRFAMSKEKKVILSTAAVLLGGGATFAALNFDSLREYFQGNQGIVTDETSKVPDSGLTNENEVTATTVRHHTPSPVQNGTIIPNENIEIAGQVREHMSFSEAYATAREEVGTGGIFSWHGQVYNTYTVEEWRDLSLNQRQEFLSDVGYRPTIGAQSLEGEQLASTNVEDEAVQAPPTTRIEPEGTAVEGESVDEEPKIEPAYFNLVINGRPALGVDDDHDGVANAIVFLEENSNNIIAFVDAEGDAMIDTVIQFDTINQQIIGQEAIEEPFMAEIGKLEALGYVNESNVDIALGNDTEENLNYDDNDYSQEDGYVNDAELPEMD